jgi:hypothetical protein
MPPVAKNAKDILHNQRRQAEAWFIQQQKLGPQQKRARNGEHLLLPARKRARLLAPTLLQAWEPFPHAREIRRHIGVSPRIGTEAKILLHRQFHEGAAPIRHMRHTKPRDGFRHQARNTLAGKQHFAFRADQA